jgi:hypothetical protein
MSSAPTPQEIWQDARWLAQAVDPKSGLVRFVEMSGEDYREISFLDDRVLEASRNAHLLKWTDISGSMPARARDDARWIFHVGHVGSTLISRLLGELGNVLSVREPRALRDLTFFLPDIRDQFVPTVRSLMSRTFDPRQAAVVKATSMVSEISPELIGENGRALFLSVSPETYLQTILAGDRSQSELQSLASYYSARALARGIEWPDSPKGPAEVAALVWSCEMAALEDAAAALPSGSILWLDFDAFLEAPETALSESASFLGLPAADERIREIARGPLMRRYSKALDHEFGPDARRQLLDEAAASHGPAIQSALAMLQQAAENTPALARAIDRTTPDR